MSAAVVLIVEDEPLVQAMAVDVVEEAGFRTFTASSASEALDVLDRTAEVTILFTDIQMAGAMNGKELAWAAREQWPYLSLILTTGYSPDGLGDLPPGACVLPKPYRPDQLEELLHQLSSPGRSQA